MPRRPQIPLLALSIAASAWAQLGDAAGDIQFNRDIRPILSDRCFYCHGPDDKERKADFRLDTRDGATADLGGYAAIVPGDPDRSVLLELVTADDDDDLMPPPKSKKARLSEAEVETLRQWIADGAEYQGHWAFEPVKAPPVPEIGAAHPIDAFVRARLAEEGVEPSPRADRYTLIRRASLDLTGLLPSPEEVAAFVADDSPDAYPKLVDRLLASPHYGERWGRHWLDGARYADSDGYAIDGERQMWPYRDWVIGALNDDMPFDQFTIEQIAGDLLPDATKSQIAATAFHRNTLINQEGGSDPEQFRVEATIDRVNTTGAVWLGLTLSCAQCHTHKFDPIQHREYYELFAFFNAAEDRNNRGPTLDVREGELLRSPEPATAGDAAPAAWSPLRITGAKTASGAPIDQLPDGSLRPGGELDANEAYQIVGTTTTDSVASVRIRTLTDGSLPKGGPGRAGNGNFVLTRATLWLDGEPLQPGEAFADHQQPGYPAAAAIDGDKETGWAINVAPGSKAEMNAAHELVINLPGPVATGGRPLELRLHHDLNEGYLIGRFAIDVSPTRAAPSPSSPAGAEAKLMVMRDLKQPRETYLLTRGDFTRPDKEAGTLEPGVLSAVAPALQAADAPRNRLDLARWLISPENPLTPRVTVNRIWMRYFGIGLVETEEDFGTQGSLPSHPGLLDYLATRFVADGWSMKSLHRLIVTSETYQQSSKARPDLAEVDPRNLLLARQARVRLDAEIVRDAALCASGLLEAEIGGPSVRPPQPPGIYAFTQRSKSWPEAQGADRYRRAMYTMFFRSAPYPLFGNFDAPDFQSVCTRRPRSNTPLQALNMANDPAFLEFARGLAARVIEELPGPPAEQLEARLARAFAHTLCRLPSERELDTLTTYARAARSDFAGDVSRAMELADRRLVATKTPPADAAALVAAARVLLNTDNFITRE